MSGAVGSKPTLIVSGVPRWSFAFRSFFSIRSTVPLARKASCSSRVMGADCNRDPIASAGAAGEDELHHAPFAERVEVIDGLRDQPGLSQGGNNLAARPGALLVRLPDTGPLAIGQGGPAGEEGLAMIPGTRGFRGDLQMECLTIYDERLLHPPDHGIDLRMIHVEEEEGARGHESPHLAKDGHELLALADVIEAVVQTGDARECSSKRQGSKVAGREPAGTTAPSLEHGQRRVDPY